MKKIILFIFVILEMSYSDISIDKVKRLNNMIQELSHKIIRIKNSELKYNRMIIKYKKILSKNENLIKLCNKNSCNNELIELKENFVKLKQSMETLRDIIEINRVYLHYLKKQKNTIKGLIKMENFKDTLERDDVERAINAFM